MPRGGVGGAALSVLLAGSVSSVLAKVMYQMQAPGCAGEVKHFEKPWASTLLMFLAMALCLPAAVAAPHLQAWLRRLDAAAGGGASEDGLREPLLRQGGSIGSASTASSLTPGRLTPAAAGSSARGTALPGRRALLVVLVPTAFDLLATLLLAAALLTITASSFMMLRGSEVLWAALLATTWLRRPLNRWHLAGIAICSAGITLVGLASFLEGGDPQQGPQSLWAVCGGMLLVTAAEAVQAAQVVSEDWVMGSMSLAPLMVVGLEGVFGTAAMLCLLLPVVQVLPGREGAGIHEDSWDTLAMLAASPALRAAALVSVATMAVYNVAGMVVTEELGAVTRTVLETTRTLFVWLVQLLLFYAAPLGEGAQLGEPWTAWSWLQALGFGVLVAGTYCYGHGEEVQARRLRAKLRWARLRASLALVISGRTAAQPLEPPRIAGPGRIRTAMRWRRAIQAVVEQLAEASGRSTPQRPPSSTPGPSSVHASAMAAAAAAAAAELEGGGEEGEDVPTSPTAAWVKAASPVWVPGLARSGRGASFHFTPNLPGISRSAPS